MTLLEFAERELREAGLLDKDGDYGGMLGDDVLQLVKVFAEQGHSGNSAQMAIRIFSRVASYKLLSPMKNPMVTGEYIDHSDSYGGKSVFQSTRLSSVFSDDGGKTWYDIDIRVPWWKRMLGVRVMPVKFEEHK